MSSRGKDMGVYMVVTRSLHHGSYAWHLGSATDSSVERSATAAVAQAGQARWLRSCGLLCKRCLRDEHRP